MHVREKKTKPIRLLRRDLSISRIWFSFSQSWRPANPRHVTSARLRASKDSMTSFFDLTGRPLRSELAIQTAQFDDEVPAVPEHFAALELARGSRVRSGLTDRQPAKRVRLSSPCRGTRARTVVPPAGRDVTESSPFTKCALSRMLMSPSPRPLRALCWSKPMP